MKSKKIIINVFISIFIQRFCYIIIVVLKYKLSMNVGKGYLWSVKLVLLKSWLIYDSPNIKGKQSRSDQGGEEATDTYPSKQTYKSISYPIHSPYLLV